MHKLSAIMVRVIETAAEDAEEARGAAPLHGMSRMPGSAAAPGGKTPGDWPRSKRPSGIAAWAHFHPA